MKKFVVFLIIFVSLFALTGCGKDEDKVTRFSTEKKVESTKVETKTPKSEPAKTTKEEEVKFAITSLKENVLKSDKGYHLIQGTTPKNTQKIVVNNYALSKYEPGDTDWSYIAATSLGTLKKGENKYVVKVIDKRGKEIASESFTIVYDGASGGILIATGSSATLTALFTVFMAFGIYSLRRRLFESA